MTHVDGSTRRLILEVTARILEDTSSEELRLVDVANSAFIAVPTIYYYFESKARLVAEAQALTYQNLSEPLVGMLDLAERAIAANDETNFWHVVGRHLVLAWASGQRNDERSVVNVLRDVLSDPTTQSDFDDNARDTYQRWVEVMERAQALGWVERDIDAGALITSFWSASVGQTIVGRRGFMDISPERIRDLFVGIARSKEHAVTSIQP